MSDTEVPEIFWFEVKNWDRFQHYTKRRPPWIKLYARSLPEDEAFKQYTDSAKALYFYVLTTAAKFDGYLPADPRYLENHLGLNGQQDYFELVNQGALIPCDSSRDRTDHLFEDSQSLEAATAEYRRADQMLESGFAGVAAPPEPRTDQPSENGSKPKSKSGKPSTAAKNLNREYQVSFENFWGKYPKEGRVAKAAAGDIWEKTKLSKYQIEIMEGLECWSISEKWAGRGLIENPTTFLNQARWRERPVPAKHLEQAKHVMDNDEDIPF